MEQRTETALNKLFSEFKSLDFDRNYDGVDLDFHNNELDRYIQGSILFLKEECNSYERYLREQDFDKAAYLYFHIVNEIPADLEMLNAGPLDSDWSKFAKAADLLYGIGPEKNENRARDLLQDCSQNSAAASYLLGDLATNLSIKSNFYKQSGKAGSVAACFKMALLLNTRIKGGNLEQEVIANLMKLLEFTAGKGYIPAFYNLAKFYTKLAKKAVQGSSEQQNYFSEAQKYFRAVALEAKNIGPDQFPIFKDILEKVRLRGLKAQVRLIDIHIFQAGQNSEKGNLNRRRLQAVLDKAIREKIHLASVVAAQMFSGGNKELPASPHTVKRFYKVFINEYAKARFQLAEFYIERFQRSTQIYAKIDYLQKSIRKLAEIFLSVEFKDYQARALQKLIEICVNHTNNLYKINRSRKEPLVKLIQQCQVKIANYLPLENSKLQEIVAILAQPSEIRGTNKKRKKPEAPSKVVSRKPNSLPVKAREPIEAEIPSLLYNVYTSSNAVTEKPSTTVVKTNAAGGKSSSYSNSDSLIGAVTKRPRLEALDAQGQSSSLTGENRVGVPPHVAAEPPSSGLSFITAHMTSRRQNHSLESSRSQSRDPSVNPSIRNLLNSSDEPVRTVSQPIPPIRLAPTSFSQRSRRPRFIQPLVTRLTDENEDQNMYLPVSSQRKIE